MKKIFSAAASLLLAASLSFSLAAVPENRMETPSAAGTNMPEADYHILKTSSAPVIDGSFDGESAWGAPIIDVTGEDAYWYTVEQEKFQAKYPSWAKTGSNLWEKKDGSVEFMKKIRVRLYSRWDDTKLYFAFVVEGNIQKGEDGSTFFYDNRDAMWFANNVEITLGPENPELNFSQNASDADFDGVYQSGYVGNEYLFAITDSSAGESVGVVNQGQYDGRGIPGGKIRCIKGTQIAAKNDASVSTGLQVYEMALPFEAVNCSVNQGLPEEKGGKGGIPFTCAVNVQCKDAYSAESLQGFQMGKGLFYRDFPQIFNSLKLILEEDIWTCPGHTGGEHLKNCSAQAKCSLCDERYGAFGEHLYDDQTKRCVYCTACEVHQFNEEGVCTVCGAVEVQGDELLIGDVNGDKKINSTDAVLLKRYLAKWDISSQLQYENTALIEVAGDVNQDGKVVSTDAVLLSRYLAKWTIDSKINTVIVVK